MATEVGIRRQEASLIAENVGTSPIDIRPGPAPTCIAASNRLRQPQSIPWQATHSRTEVMIRDAATVQSRPDGSQTIAPCGAQDSDPGEGITPFFPDWVVPLQLEGTGLPVFVFPSADNEP